jgi:mono/diheme cytochrome c family protein
MRKTAFTTLLALAFLLFGAAIANADDGAALFKAKCAACHGQDGSGNTTMGKKAGLRDLGSAEVQKQTDAELTAIIAEGKGKPAHAYKNKGVTDAQIAALVAHIRTLKN